MGSRTTLSGVLSTIAALVILAAPAAGTPGALCGPGQACAVGEFCRPAVGQCQQAFGTCAAMPSFCPPAESLVCGCDGTTYDNECEATAAGVSLQSLQPCPGWCGGESCTPSSFCALPEGACNAEYDAGSCTQFPPSCPPDDDPVCGCDRITYPNPCEAQAAGVSIGSSGPCPDYCGAEVCGQDELCETPIGVCPPLQDPDSVCRIPPTSCAPGGVPVCGCDDVTYANECAARRGQVAVRHLGDCSLQVCGGIAGSVCLEPNTFCSNQEQCCDMQGLCWPIPAECFGACDPVCTLGGGTYDNLCLALQDQRTLYAAGACPPPNPLVDSLRFDAVDALGWAPAAGATAYNVYRDSFDSNPPADAGECYSAALPGASAFVPEVPLSGELWLFQVTGIYGGSEGEMGLRGDCLPRQPSVPCN